MKFTIKNYKSAISLGIYPIEKKIKNNVMTSITFDFDASKAALSDDIKDTIDYDLICQSIDKISNNQHYNLIEHFINILKADILSLDTRIIDLVISVKKLNAVPKAEYVMIETE